MQAIRLINKLKNKDRHLIDYANLSSGLMNPQIKFLDLSDIKKFLKDKSIGIPMILPININKFHYKNKNFFKIEKKIISKKIFDTNDITYVGNKRLLEFGNLYANNIKVKEKYRNIINLINKHNNKIKSKITLLTKKGFKVCAFQTRNIPHLGHELIINNLLKKYDYVVINPIIGPKKSGDIKPLALEKIFNYLIENFYSERLLYMPVIANMFYAGPREACHHAIIRKNLGFTHFAVGRDHAGAEKIYNEISAIKLAKKNEKKLGIKIVDAKGAYFCSACDSIVLRNSCKHRINNLKEISGTQFRKKIVNKNKFKHARNELQEFIYQIKNDIFEK